MADLAASQCEQCGKIDTDPKSHWSTGETYHHDCLPWAKRALLVDPETGGEHGASIVEAAESGKRGEDLRAHIAALHGKADA